MDSTTVNKLSLYPALCTGCQEKEWSDFTMTLLGFKVPDRVSQYWMWDFSLRPDLLCPVRWALLCFGSAGTCSVNFKNYRPWILFPSFFILLYLSFHLPPAHCNQWFPFLFIFLLTQFIALIVFPLDFPFSAMLLFYCSLPQVFYLEEHCRLKYIYNIHLILEKVACFGLHFQQSRSFFYKALFKTSKASLWSSKARY